MNKVLCFTQPLTHISPLIQPLPTWAKWNMGEKNDKEKWSRKNISELHAEVIFKQLFLLHRKEDSTTNSITKRTFFEH